MSPQVLFRRVALAEAVTWGLLLLGMVLKHATRTTELGVQVFGMAHGVVVIAFGLVTLFVAVDQRWSVRLTLLGLASAVPPFATVWFDRFAERRGALVGSWRLRPGGERPGSTAERAQAWMLARPLAAVALAVGAVAVLTVAALVAGPPASSTT